MNAEDIFEKLTYNGKVYNDLPKEEQFILCKKYFPKGTVVDLHDDVMGGDTFSDGTRTATVVGYKPIGNGLKEFDNYCITLDKEFVKIKGFSGYRLDNFIHPSLLTYNVKYIREEKIKRLLNFV